MCQCCNHCELLCAVWTADILSAGNQPKNGGENQRSQHYNEGNGEILFVFVKEFSNKVWVSNVSYL